jgi:hypothetical protein
MASIHLPGSGGVLDVPKNFFHGGPRDGTGYVAIVIAPPSGDPTMAGVMSPF